MTTRAYSVRNYRAFASETRVELKPLTLFFGYNSSGKSALLRWLPILRDSVERRGSSPLSMASAALRGGSFSSLLSKFSSSDAVGFAISSGGSNLSFVVRDLPEQKRQIVETITYVVDGISTSLTWEASPEYSDLYNLRSPNGDRQTQVKFDGLFPTIESPDHQIAELGRTCLAIAEAWLAEIYWLQANRATPPRKEVFSGFIPDLEPNGTGVTQMLFAEDGSDSDVLSCLSKWYKEATGHRLTLVRGAFSSSEMFSFCLEAAGKPIELADTGEGIGQVLPIVGLLLLARQGRLGAYPTLLFEHPELHLHSAAEPGLANLMCQVAASGKACVVAETHSETFLLALQLALLDGHLRPEDCAVYWVRQAEGAPATLTTIDFDTDGRPRGAGWPPGVFNEKTEQARKLVLARRAKLGNAR